MSTQGRGNLGTPDLGVGVGLRVPHYAHILEQRPAMDFFEVISENFMVPGGKPVYHLEQVARTYAIVQHGVSLSIGAPAEPDKEYLARLKRLVRKLNPPWLSDHFCWCGVPGAHLHDLLPLPYNPEVVERVARRAHMLQDYLEVRFALENTSSYMAYTSSTMTEWEFISEVAEKADIGLMFDVNNVYVSAYNHGFDPYAFIRGIPHERIVQIHLAGHTNLGKYIIDTHNGHVIDPVYELYQATIEMAGPVSTLIEWDDEIPAWNVLAAEADKAKKLRHQALARRGALLEGGRQPDLSERRMVLKTAAADADTNAVGWNQGGPRESAAHEVPHAALD